MFLKYISLLSLSEKTFIENKARCYSFSEDYKKEVQKWLTNENTINIHATIQVPTDLGLASPTIDSLFAGSLCAMLDHWESYIKRKNYIGQTFRRNCLRKIIKEGLADIVTTYKLREGAAKLKEKAQKRGGYLHTSDLDYTKYINIVVTNKGYDRVDYIKYGFFGTIFFQLSGVLLNNCFAN